MNLIEFKNVNFSYAIDDDDENQVTVDVLKNFNLTIEKGTKLLYLHSSNRFLSVNNDSVSQILSFFFHYLLKIP